MATSKAEGGARPSPDTNLLDYIQKVLARSQADVLCSNVRVRRTPAGMPDVQMFFRDPCVSTTSRGRRLLSALSSIAPPGGVRRIGRRVTIRVADGLVAERAAALVSGRMPGLEVAECLGGKVYSLNFLDPNTTKALHVGHLRNIVLASAIAAILTASGGRVERRCVLGDIGRSMCEALAGYLRFHNGATPATERVKPDHFVGQCYLEYVRSCSHAKKTRSAMDGPLTRELAIVDDDLANELLRRWVAGDGSVCDLWRQVRSWALAGQQETLDRLGAAFDRKISESDMFEDMDRLVKQALGQGVFQYDSDRAIVYRTGREEYATMTVVRRDGVPTQHMRLVAMISRNQTMASRVDRYITVAGAEWHAAVDVYRELLAKLTPCPLYERKTTIHHGMVVMDGQKMGSSAGGAVLIDDLMEKTVASKGIRRMVEATGRTTEPETLALIVMKTYFLSVPASKPIRFTWERFFDEQRNPGWLVARAWAVARSRCGWTRYRSDPARQTCRWLVMQSQEFGCILRRAADDCETHAMTRRLIELCDWYLESEDDGQVARMVRTIVGQYMVSLGLIADSSAR